MWQHRSKSIDALLDEEMVSDDDLKVSQKRKSTGLGTSKVSRRAVTLSQEAAILSCHRSHQHTLSTLGRKKKVFRANQRAEAHYSRGALSWSAKLLTRKNGTVDDVLSDQEILQAKKNIVQVKSQISQDEEV